MKPFYLFICFALASCGNSNSCAYYGKLVIRYDACIAEPKCEFRAEEYASYQFYIEKRDYFCAKTNRSK